MKALTKDIVEDMTKAWLNTNLEVRICWKYLEVCDKNNFRGTNCFYLSYSWDVWYIYE